MTTLTTDVTATEPVWRISAPLAAGVTHLQAEDEVVACDLHSPNALVIRVTRGAGGNAASHVSGTTVTPLVPQFASDAIEGPGGGGVSVTDGTTTVAATSIQLPVGSVSDLGGGVAGAILPPVNLIGTDPDTTPFSVQAAPAQTGPTFRVFDEDGGEVAELGASGLGVQDPNSNAHLNFHLDGSLSLRDPSSNEYLAYSGATNPTLRLGGGEAAYVRHEDDSGNDFLGISANTEPPDAFIFRGSCWLWFDKTEGAAKLMLKGKDQGDNIVTAAIPLA